MQKLSNQSKFSKYIILFTTSTALSLSACKKTENAASEYDEESNISIDIDEDGVAIEASGDFTDDNRSASSSTSTSSSSSKNGKFSLNADGFNLDIDIPQSFIKKSKSNDGLYPGSEIRNVNVNTHSNNDNGKSYERAEVRLEFTAPDNSNKVANWFVKKFKEEGGTAKRNGNTVSGQTDEGKDYNLTLNPNGNRTNGVLHITGIDE